jgi:D-arginine utilization repressor
MKNDRIPVWLEAHVPLCEAVAALFQPLVEVTVHDLRRDRVVASWNGGGRAVGPAGRALLDLAADPASRDVVGPLATGLTGGRAGTSVGVVLRNAKGAPRGLLVIAFDRSPLDDVVSLLAGFATPQEQAPRPPELEWREQIAAVIEGECRAAGLRKDRLTRVQRLAVVRALDDRGLFSTRHAASHAAQVLGVSRTTVYALLKETRS